MEGGKVRSTLGPAEIEAAEDEHLNEEEYVPSSPAGYTSPLDDGFVALSMQGHDGETKMVKVSFKNGYKGASTVGPDADEYEEKNHMK